MTALKGTALPEISKAYVRGRLGRTAVAALNGYLRWSGSCIKNPVTLNSV